MNDKQHRIETAKETLVILENLAYEDTNAKRHFLQKEMESMIAGTVHYSPNQLDALVQQKVAASFETNIELTKEDTVSTIFRKAQVGSKVLCLNFASARNPGGGFLTGAVAQEESLALSSGLYKSQLSKMDFYETHRRQPSGFYTDAMIYSPAVPFFRDFSGALVPTVTCSIVTSPAVNAGVIKQRFPNEVDAIPEVMATRIEKLLALAAAEGYTRLILGAWGCGVFQNEPKDIAQLFKAQLDGQYKGVFEEVIFSVYSHKPKFFDAFAQVFGQAENVP